MSASRAQLFICGDLCNLGDLALLLQNLEVARRERRRAYVRRWAPLPAEVEAQVAAAGGTLVGGQDLVHFLRIAARCDMVIGGGQLVRDNVSLRGLLFLLSGSLAVKRGGGRITTRGLGVSPIREPRRRFLWRQVLKRADDIRVRDSSSKTNAEALVPGAAIRLTADMAFLPTELHSHADSNVAARTILIAPCIDRSENRSIDGPAFADLLAAARARFPDAPIVFACHDPRPGMDGTAADQLIRSHGLTGARKSDGYDLSALLAEYQAAALVITNRLHSLVFSLLSEKPVIVVGDGSTKLAAIGSRFAVPSLSLQAKEGAVGTVEAALSYDRGLRAAELSRMAKLAADNLTSS